MSLTDHDQHTDFAVDALASEGATLVLEYGSSVRTPETANDIDLFAVYENDTDRTTNIRFGPFEVIRLTKDEFRTYRRVLNPVHCTEPILNGAVRYGSKATFAELRDALEQQDPTPDAVRHNLQRSYEEYRKALEFLDRGRLETASLTLPFVASYRLFAEWYADGNTPATLATVRRHTGTELPVDESFALCDRVKADEEVTEAAVCDAVDAWKPAMIER